MNEQLKSEKEKEKEKEKENWATQKAANTGSYVNGRGQVAELLKYLGQDERNRILKQLKIKNPQLAHELAHEGISFQHIEKLSDQEIVHLFPYLAPAIWGLALKGVTLELQKRILRVVPKHLGEQAYDTMVSPIKNEVENVQKAQKKVLNLLSELHQKKQISFI
jgi:flagellar motor switch protein FliG